MKRPTANPNQERGYILLTLIFFVAVLAISLATILPSIKQEILRDREEEMVHRGTQYTRAIRLYYKKSGRYPAKIEDLESTNNLRFLRKRYKDPTVKGEDSGEGDFKLLRFGDPNLQMQQAGQIPGAQGLQPQGAVNSSASSQAVRTRLSQNNLDLAQQPDATDPSQSPDAPAQDASGNPTPAAGAAAPASGDPATAADPASGNKSGDNPLYGGGAIVGVVSTNTNDRNPAIREYNKKHHYNEWQFVYDPQNDRGGLPNGPWQPAQFPGQAGGQKPIGTPADQISNPVAPPAGNPDQIPAPTAIPQQ